MRKLKIRKKEDNVKRNVAIVFLVLLTLSTLGYSIVNSFNSSNAGPEVTRDGFVAENGIWSFEVAGQKYYFSNLPKQVENVSIVGNFSLGDYYSKPLYFVNDMGVSFEILNNLQRYTERNQKACVDGVICDDMNLPVKNCSSDNVIIFTSGENSVSKDENCIYISGDSLKSSDKFLYEVLKIK
jgi:hypothetical protein